jgi:hypothetical protein
MVIFKTIIQTLTLGLHYLRKKEGEKLSEENADICQCHVLPYHRI